MRGKYLSAVKTHGGYRSDQCRRWCCGARSTSRNRLRRTHMPRCAALTRGSVVTNTAAPASGVPELAKDRLRRCATPLLPQGAPVLQFAAAAVRRRQLGGGGVSCKAGDARRRPVDSRRGRALTRGPGLPPLEIRGCCPVSHSGVAPNKHNMMIYSSSDLRA